MRNNYTRYLAALGLLVGAWQPARAQSEASRQAAELALQTRQQWAGADVAAADMRISSARTEGPGLLYAYPQQLQAGIPVYNQVTTLVFKNGKLAHHAGSFVSAKAFAGLSAAPRVPAATAVATAIATLPGRPGFSPASLGGASGADKQQRFAAGGVARRPIEARLVWAMGSNRTPRLAWNVNVDVLASADWLNIRVDATTGQVLGQDNWTVSEKAEHLAGPARTYGANLVHASAAPTLRSPSGAKRVSAVTPASYIVVPFPGERADVTTPVTDTNPWLRAGAGNPATTNGWHFDGTTNYTDTRGNNVWAYDDSLKQNAPGRFATSTGTTSSLVFNYIPDFTAKPTLGKNRRAATVNLFYWNNLMHDVMYQYGFNEASANFQTDNLGRGGVGANHVRAEAQDGSGLNNANFSTPPDGTSGRMQMFLWNATSSNNLVVTTPAAIAGTYTMAEGSFSTANLLANKGTTSGTLAYYTDPGATTHIACSNPSSTSVSGKIALIYRGTCTYTAKVKAAQNEGAIAVVMVNNAAGAPVTMGGTDNTITIPAVMVSQADGATLAAQLNAGATVQLTLRPPLQLDGDFDSGIMAHEYGHGISNRLTAGGPNTSCLGNAEQAGEGWSDFFALMMTTDWASAQTTDGPNARPMGNYAQGQAPSGGGLRRYPYSTSLAVNPLTYANVASNPEVHAIGEIWTATVWDMTWNIIQQQGTIETNLYNSASTGGNAVALNLVMQGLKLQPCEPGFLDSRDAILAADSLLYGGRYHCAIWGAFARRGMGFSAREGSSNSATDQTAAYDLPGVRLAKNSVPMVGSQFAINLTATCECQTQAPVSLTEQLPTGLQYVSSTGGTLSGSTVTFPSLSFATGQQRIFQIVARTATGSGCAVTLPVNDNRDGNTLGGFTPAVVTNGGGNAWAPTTTRAHSGTTAWGTGDPNATSDITLTSAAFTPGAFSVLSFYHFFNSEARYDGGMVAISVNNGTWQDASALFLQNGYNSTFDASTASPNKPCFSGKSSGLTGAAAFQLSLVDLSSFSGQSIRVRFQFQSDSGNPYSNALPGWYVDDIQVQSGCGGLQQVQLLSSTSTVLGSYARPTFLVPVPTPVITLLSPNSGPAGTSVTITGTDLNNATGLTLNGVAITAGAITANTATSLTFTLPTGVSTGLLTVTTSGGTSNGLTFTVTYPDLTISTGTTASPTAVAAGTYNSITVTGTGVATLGGSTVVNTALTVQSGGTFDTNCQPLTGAASFTLAAGATLRICDPAGISAGGATGAVRTTGARSFSADASYVYTSTDANPQPTGSGLPATVRNLTNATTGGLYLTQPVAVTQVVALPNASNLNLNGQALTLLSDANGTALIANTGGGVVTGNTGTLQRHIETNTAASGYRHYASPMQAGAGAETLTTLATTGYTPDFSGAAAYNSSATPSLVTPFPTVFSYNQDRIAGLNSTYGTFDKGWQAALGTDVPQVGRGYSVQALGAALVDFTGTFTTGNVSRSNLQRASTDPATGWHLLGNPFPSPLDWSTMTLGTTATDNLQSMDGAVYVYQSSGPYAGSYRTYLAGAPGLASPIIPAGAGFFVHTTAASTPGTVRFTGTNRVTTFGAQPAFGRNAADMRPQLTLELRGTAGRDAVTVYADPAATAGLDAALDALKLPNPTGLNLSAQAGASQLAINGLPAFGTGTMVPLAVGVPAAGAYTLAVNELLNLPAGGAVLVDTQLGARTDLATLPVAGYAFSVTSTQAATSLAGRFYLNLSAAGPLGTAAGHSATSLALFPNPTHGGSATLTGTAPGSTVTVMDALGRTVLSAPADAKGTATLALPANLPTGVYVVRAGAKALKLTVE